MESLYNQFSRFHVLKKFKELLSEWWNIDLFLIEKGPSGFFYDSETKINNPVVKALLDSKMFQGGFIDAINSINKQPPFQKDQTCMALWKQVHFNVFAVPLIVGSSHEGFIVATGFKNDNEGRLEKALQYLQLPPQWITSELKKLKSLNEADLSYIKKLLFILAEECFSLFKERQQQKHLIEQLMEERSPHRYEELVGKSPSMQFLYGILNKIRKFESTILIQGEHGTGKELVALAIHAQSPRAGMPFIAQNCSAFNDNLLESELFGHTRGSFSGATRDKKGLFEMAHGGTFFLDEIGDTSPALQAKLLRVLQESTFFPVGGTTLKKVNVRIIAASNKDLKALSETGAFRQDLFYRLNVINIKTPPLRERPEDITLLVNHFIRRLAPGTKKGFSKKVLEYFYNYSWPGNVRELENEIEKLLVLSDENEKIITDEHLSSKIKQPDGVFPSSASFAGQSLKEAVRTLEKRMIAQCLKKENGNKTKAAKILGLSRTSIILKAREYNLIEPESA